MCFPDEVVFHKSTYSASANECVEVAECARGAAVRDSRTSTEGSLVFPVGEWQAFLRGARSGLL
ncbi:uncharacterized protein DUF397 [Haloactinospora alba]|uniref:Uncharacterized protein DUF397 n=1 Tax=Haloactinospora alba TaxID=405555 RepID=A0A543NG02_9ACTN|nr:DUF397 domain-containing protein [Haloactinospora alba]TQN30700.1 uncharacterized protein DUF397 [Haloactinospora alba]